jgi:hypothetical protein
MRGANGEEADLDPDGNPAGKRPAARSNTYGIGSFTKAEAAEPFAAVRQIVDER